MSGLRVTDQMTLDQVLANLQLNSQALDRQNQIVSSGHAISQPSDDPYGTSQVDSFHQRMGLNTQLQTNLNAAHGWLDATDQGLGAMTSVLQRARELAIQASNDTLTDSQRQQMATEVHQILLNMVDLGNSKFGGEYIFAGTKVTTQPFIHDGSAQSPNVSAGSPSPVSYTGDTGAVTRQIDQAAQLSLNVDGSHFAAVFGDLSQLEYDLNNSQSRVSGAVSGIDGVNGMLTGTANSIETFSINGVKIGTNVTPASGPLAGKTVVGFAPGTKISQVVQQINTQMAGQVTASVDRNGVLVLQAVQPGAKVVVSMVDQVTTDAAGNDATNGTGVPVGTGGNSARDLGLSNNIDNTIGSADVFALDADLTQISSLRSAVGAKTNRVDDGTQRLSGLGITLAQLDSKIEDADMAKAISDLASRQATLQAALGAAAKVLPPNLFQFLR